MNRSILEAIPGDLDKLQTRIENRFGVLPKFFRLAPENLEVTANLWEFAQFAYLDNPLPSLFKERLFVYLSRFCKVRYCVARHAGFLVGLGRPSGDDQCSTQTIEEIVRLLRRPLPRAERLEPHVSRLASCKALLAEFPEPDSALEEAILACATHVFLQTPDAPRCLDALMRAFGESGFEYMMAFLAFIRTEHYWASVHTELQIEEDVQRLLATYETLAECVLNGPEDETGGISQKLMDELASLQETKERHDELLQGHQAVRESEEQARRANAELTERVAELQKLTVELQNARRAALNLMEDAVRARAELAEAEERYRSLVSIITDVPWTADAEGRFVTPQPAWAAYTGQSWDELRDFGWTEALHPEDRENVRSAWRRDRESRYLHESHGRLWHAPSRQYRYFEARATPLFDPDGGVREWVGSCTDVHDRKVSETALRESEEQFRRLLDTLPVAAYTCDAEGLITYFNERAVEAWGGAPTLNDPVERFCGSYRLHSSDGALIPHDQCWMALAIKEHKVYEGREIVIERPDGSRLTVLAHVNPFYNEAGKLLGAVNIVVDITDRKQAEAAMAQMAAIVESSADAIISKDLNGIIASWNKGAEKLFGYTAAEVIGNSVTILIPPDRMDEEPRILEHLRRGETIDRHETVRMRKDGSEIDISLTVSPIRDKSGKVIGASKIASDITERKRSEIEREELLLKEKAARAEAEAANRSKDEFLAVVSHELRSPLGAILGYNNMLREKPSDTAQRKLFCDIIERNAKTQLQLIEDLLDTARIASGKLRLELRPLDIIPMLADALDVVRPAAEAKSVKLGIAERGVGSENGATRKEPAILLADAARLRQIVWNLLSNAIKFTPAGGCVELRAERDEGHIRIIVSDTGNGIQPEVLPHVFDRFRQADSSSSRRYDGLGLGLALVKDLVELHGGKVEAASEGAGCGSTFTVTLPLATQSELVAVEPPALALADGANGEQTRGAIPLPDEVTIAGLRVLVVDDQEEARVLLATLLSRYGAVVTTTSSGAEALAVLANTADDARPDILVCDIAMPMEDGYTALRRMRALEEARGVAASQYIPAIALTALTGNEERLRALSAGFQCHIAKPVDSVDLIVMIANIAGLSRRKRNIN
jgi:PAS domain S-box-containing protein